MGDPTSGGHILFFIVTNTKKMTWREFVRDLQKKEGISYKNALVKASPLWKEQKAKKAKAPKRKKGSQEESY